MSKKNYAPWFVHSRHISSLKTLQISKHLALLLFNKSVHIAGALVKNFVFICGNIPAIYNTVLRRLVDAQGIKPLMDSASAAQAMN